MKRNTAIGNNIHVYLFKITNTAIENYTYYCKNNNKHAIENYIYSCNIKRNAVIGNMYMELATDRFFRQCLIFNIMLHIK